MVPYRAALSALILLGACSATTATPTATAQVTPTPTPSPTPLICGPTQHVSLQQCVENTPEPTPSPTPVPLTYATLTSREWAQLVKAPDSYTGMGYQLLGCITQFDAATGLDTFRAQASYQNEASWYADGVNAFFNGDEAQLADFVANDVVAMSVVSLGSYSYDTQAGGNTTVPLFSVVTIQRKGSC